jgi:hypothetical protein
MLATHYRRIVRAKGTPREGLTRRGGWSTVSEGRRFTFGSKLERGEEWESDARRKSS